MGLNITVHSYVDELDFGLISCRELVPDLWDLVDLHIDEIDRAVRGHRRRVGPAAGPGVDARRRAQRTPDGRQGGDRAGRLHDAGHEEADQEEGGDEEGGDEEGGDEEGGDEEVRIEGGRLMLRHVVMFKWNGSVDPAHVAAVATGLDGLRAEIPQITAYHHGPDAGINDGNFDYVVVGDFADRDDYLTYRDHPLHTAFIGELIAGHVDGRSAVQYEI